MFIVVSLVKQPSHFNICNRRRLRYCKNSKASKAMIKPGMEHIVIIVVKIPRSWVFSLYFIFLSFYLCNFCQVCFAWFYDQLQNEYTQSHEENVWTSVVLIPKQRRKNENDQKNSQEKEVMTPFWPGMESSHQRKRSKRWSYPLRNIHSRTLGEASTESREQRLSVYQCTTSRPSAVTQTRETT